MGTHLALEALSLISQLLLRNKKALDQAQRFPRLKKVLLAL